MQNHGIPQTEFSESIRRSQQEAQAHKCSMPRVVRQIWKSEGLTSTLVRHPLPSNSLRDPLVPRQSWAITHVAYGAASAVRTRFDSGKLHEIASSSCVPDCRGFFYEGIGSMLRACEPGTFKWLCEGLRMIPPDCPHAPDRTGFFTGFYGFFSSEQARLISHGYGRIIAVSSISIARALKEAIRLPSKHVTPAVMGASPSRSP
jgi:hypothetical protein